MEQKNPELPLGFAFGLAENLPAMERFTGMPQAQREAWIARARGVRSKAEMQRLIAALGKEMR